MKKYKNKEELIMLMKDRRIKFSDVEEQYKYVKKYSYNMVLNPYKIFHCTGYSMEKGHVYEKESDFNEYIEFHKKQLQMENVIFKHIKEFELIFSTLLMEQVFREIDGYILKIKEVQNKIIEIDSKFKIQELNNFEKKQIFKQYEITTSHYYGVKNIEKKIGVDNGFDCFSLFHGSGKIDFGTKIAVFTLVEKKWEIFKEIQNTYGYNRIKKIEDIKKINQLRNLICHHNSIAYAVYKDMKIGTNNKRPACLRSLSLLNLVNEKNFYSKVEEEYKKKVIIDI